MRKALTDSECLFAEFLREEERGNDDGEDDGDERDGGAEGWISDFGGEPVVGALRDHGEDDGSDDGGEEGPEDEGAEDEDAEGEEEESDLLPICLFAAILHGAVAPS